MLQVGDSFPEFRLQDQNGDWVCLNDLKGKIFVVYVYPKDDTPGCTVEACQFRDALVNFGDVPVFGLSADSVQSHQKFGSKYALNFRLLSDPEKTLLTAIGSYGEKVLYGKMSLGIIRSTFIIDSEGKVQRVWKRVVAAGHANAVLKSLQ